MATNPLSFDEVRLGGLPVYSQTVEEKWHEMQLLLDYDRTQLIEDAIIGQSMHGQSICWHYHPHAWSIRCGGRLSPRDTFASSERLENALSLRRKYGN